MHRPAAQRIPLATKHLTPPVPLSPIRPAATRCLESNSSEPYTAPIGWIATFFSRSLERNKDARQRLRADGRPRRLTRTVEDAELDLLAGSAPLLCYYVASLTLGNLVIIPSAVNILVQLNSRFVVLPSIVLAGSVSVQLTILAERREAVTMLVYFKARAVSLSSRMQKLQPYAGSCNMPKLSRVYQNSTTPLPWVKVKARTQVQNKLSTDAMPAFKTAAAAHAIFTDYLIKAGLRTYLSMDQLLLVSSTATTENPGQLSLIQPAPYSKQADQPISFPKIFLGIPERFTQAQ
ncbi:hypothetical protein B0H14DRAFT_2624885 [Mycena olivaceomarginata]|nr:hypothetical protein B0H14DRAFT_2624885 [Mycena olivaceomarginata]